jgi:hypothetical protein
MNRILVYLLLIATAPAASAQDTRLVEDGSWWRGLTPAFKLGYISGYARGTGLANVANSVGCLALWSELKAIKTAYTLEQWKPLCLPANDFDGVKTGQFLAQLRKCYADMATCVADRQ